MDTALQTKLARLTNRGTRYEIIATHGPGLYRSILIGYTARRSYRGLFGFQENLKHFLKITGIQDYGKREKGAFIFCDGWILKFSGRTQRDAYIEGERPFIGTMEDLTAVS